MAVIFAVMVSFIHNILKDLISSFLGLFFSGLLYESISFILSLIFILLILKKISKKHLDFPQHSWSNWTTNIWLGISVVMILSYLLIYNNTLGILVSYLPINPLFQSFQESPEFNINYIVFGVIINGPIVEEVVSRGIIIQKLQKRFSQYKVILISALTFATVHFDIQQGINAFFIGCILGYIYLKTKSLLLCIFLHILNNAYIILC